LKNDFSLTGTYKLVEKFGSSEGDKEPKLTQKCTVYKVIS